MSIAISATQAGRMSGKSLTTCHNSNYILGLVACVHIRSARSRLGKQGELYLSPFSRFFYFVLREVNEMVYALIFITTSPSVWHQ